MTGSKTLIGAFVLGAAALVAVSVVVFGGGRFLQKRDLFLLHFGGSVAGLNVGAPVVLKGVRVGSVQRINIELHPQDLTFRTRVLIEVHGAIEVAGSNGATLASLGGGPGGESLKREFVQQLLDRGLKAQLELQSVVTGQLMVGLDFHPEIPVNRKIGDEEIIELPTMASSMERLTKTLDQLPIDEIVRDLRETTENLRRILSSQEVRDILSSLARTSKNLDGLSGRLLDRTGPVGEKLEKTLDDVAALVRRIEGQVEPLGEDIRATTRTAREALESAKTTLVRVDGAVDGVLGGDSAVVYELNRVLRTATEALESVKSLAEMLERNPEALLRGK